MRQQFKCDGVQMKGYIKDRVAWRYTHINHNPHSPMESIVFEVFKVVVMMIL